MRKYSGYYIILLVTFFVGCTSLFSTREAEEPQDFDNTALYETPFSYDVVLRNFRYSIIQKNVSNYMKSFIDSTMQNNVDFRFSPDPRLQKEQFFDWSLDDEMTYLQNVISKTSSRTGAINLDFSNEISYTALTSFADSVETNAIKYILQLDLGDSSAVYEGVARFKLVKNINSLWSIYYWEDLPGLDPDLFTWSWLKATNRYN